MQSYKKFFGKNSTHDYHPTVILYASLYIAFKELLCSKLQDASVTSLVLSMINDDIVKKVVGWSNN